MSDPRPDVTPKATRPLANWAVRRGLAFCVHAHPKLGKRVDPTGRLE